MGLSSREEGAPIVTKRVVGEADRPGARMGEGRPLSVRGVPTAGENKGKKHYWAVRRGVAGSEAWVGSKGRTLSVRGVPTARGGWGGDKRGSFGWAGWGRATSAGHSPWTAGELAGAKAAHSRSNLLVLKVHD